MGSVISAGWSWLFSTEFEDKDPVNEKINHDIDLWCSVPYSQQSTIKIKINKYAYVEELISKLADAYKDINLDEYSIQHNFRPLISTVKILSIVCWKRLNISRFFVKLCIVCDCPHKYTHVIK